MSLKTIAACLAGLAAGLGLGRFIPQRTSAGHPGTAEFRIPGEGRSSRTTTDAPARIRGSRAGATTDADGDRAGLHGNAGFGDAGERLVVVPAPLLGELSLAAGVRSPDQPLFSSRDDRIGELLGITDREKAGLQTAWRDYRGKIRKIEAASTAAEDLDDGSVRLTLPDLSTDRLALGGQLCSAMKGILGDDRGEIFLAVKQVERAFAPREKEWSCIVAPESTGDGRWRFHMTVEDQGGRRVWVGETIPNEIRHLTDAVGVIPSMDEAPIGQ